MQYYKNREVVGLIIGIISLIITLSPYPIFYLGVLFLSFLIGYEISKAIGFEFFYFSPLTLFFSSLSMELGILCVLILSLYAGWKSWILENFLKAFLICIYGGFLLVFLLELKSLDSFSILKLLLFVWAVDIFSYYTGKKFGKTPLAPRLSPKKTWEGFIGGALAGFLLFILLHGIKFLPWTPFMIASAVIGDLFKSYIKRSVGIKDFSNLLGEHGGFTDRFDSLIFTAPFYLYLLKF